ncbi:DUF192 domain-containing protein (plasmid) [Pseudomonas aeruginosa]|uniref:DUF192 domain-containing protein n=1 Tax=Pseudomonas aeruginosa TaxID=287 RepID=UPI0018CA77F8|nr:DUF192 domain-containing protein [Pseudomonas aeruginosa]QPN17975.1 DUF192 domain-containing protein [Pseudomonas aeruginosa]
MSVRKAARNGVAGLIVVGLALAFGTLFAIEDMQPETDDYHFSMKPALDALELAQGEFQRKGLAIGARLIRRECRALAH